MPLELVPYEEPTPAVDLSTADKYPLDGQTVLLQNMSAARRMPQAASAACLPPVCRLSADCLPPVYHQSAACLPPPAACHLPSRLPHVIGIQGASAATG